MQSQHVLAGLALGCSISLLSPNKAVAVIAGCSYVVKEGLDAEFVETWIDFHPSANKLRFTNSVTDEELECSFVLGYDADAKLENCSDGYRIFFLNQKREKFDAFTQGRCADLILLRKRHRKNEKGPVEEYEEIYEFRK